MNLEVLKKYGLPTAFALALFGVMVMQMKWQHDDFVAMRDGAVAEIAEQAAKVDALSKTVELTCRPRG